MAEAFTHTRERGGVFITANRAEQNGALTDDHAVQLTRMFDEAGKSDAKFIVYRSQGKDFCVGRDRGGASFAPPADALQFRENSRLIFDFYDAFRRSPIPIIGLVQGKALGFGCAIAALCDITVAAADARFALPEVRHKIMPTIAMSALVDRVGRKGMQYLTYTAREIDAQTALAYGLVSVVVPADGLEAELDGILSTFDVVTMPVITAIKDYARSAPNMDLRGATDYAKNLHATVNTSKIVRA